MKKRGIKNTRINTEVQRELSNIIQGGLKDPRVAPWTSVVAAEVAGGVADGRVPLRKEGGLLRGRGGVDLSTLCQDHEGDSGGVPLLQFIGFLFGKFQDTVLPQTLKTHYWKPPCTDVI